MNQSKERTQNLILYILDTFSLLLSYLFAGIIWLTMYKKVRDVSLVWGVLDDDLGIVLLSYVIVMLFFNANRNFLKRNTFDETRSAIKVNIMFGAILSVMVFMKKSNKLLPRGVYLLVIVFNILFMVISHSAMRYYLMKVRRKSKKTSRVLIMTTSDRVEQLIKNLKKKEEWHNKIVGIILVDNNNIGEKIEGIPVVATYNNMIDFIKKEIVDEILINMPYDDGRSMKNLVMELEDMGIIVHLSIEKLSEFNEFKKSLGMYGNIPVVTFANVFHDDNQLLIKRLMDIAGALVGIAITLVISIFIAPPLLIESRGPLIFKQQRVGKNGRFFYMYKFRSMYKDAEERKKELMEKNEMNGLMFKMTDDPRITKVGKFIRKTSIDELPQFFNVLKGDMSLVGTRPPTVDEFKAYEGHHKRRLSMKPGITGLWQVSGRSNIEDFEEVVKLDLKYIDNWSLGLDIRLIFKTIGVIIFGKGAK